MANIWRYLMQKNRRYFIGRLAVVAAALMGISAVNVHAETVRARPLAVPKIIAVYVYADWCPNCKILSPALEQARIHGALDQKPVLFVTLNLTDKPHIQQSILLASALGIGEFLRAQGSATGYVAILDATTKREVTRFDRSSSAEQIETIILKALEK
jgi:hypothetical protein